MKRISLSIDEKLLLRLDRYLIQAHDNRSHWVQEQVRKTTPELDPNILEIEKTKRQVSRTDRWRQKFLSLTEPGKTYKLVNIIQAIADTGEDFIPHHNTILAILHDFERDGVITIPGGLNGRETVIGRL